METTRVGRGASCATGCVALAVAMALGALTLAGGVALGCGLLETVQVASL